MLKKVPLTAGVPLWEILLSRGFPVSQCPLMGGVCLQKKVPLTCTRGVALKEGFKTHSGATV